MKPTEMQVTSHVGRNLIANASTFKTEASAVWEYVVNSLQYTERGVAPKIQVDIEPRNKRIRISDNGRGMTARDLKHFFQLHGENRDRAAGRPGRGKFGTGKSAAFGIANKLTVDTRHQGKRNVVSLSRTAIDESNGKDIPTEWTVRNEPTNLSNGTVVSIDEIAIARIEAQPIIEYIERHLSAWRSISPAVAVNEHVCSAREPRINRTEVFKPTEELRKILGEVLLRVHVAQTVLQPGDQGVQITCGVGNLVAIETAGVDRKEHGAFLFGEIDCPALESFPTTIEPFSASRDLTLRSQHPVAATLIQFIGMSLEKVRQELAAQAREYKKTEQARRLNEAASQIAQVLNTDFEHWQRRLTDIRVASGGGTISGVRARELEGGDSDTAWTEGSQETGEIHSSIPQRTESGTRRTAPNIPRQARKTTDGNRSVDAAGGSGSKRRTSGGFQVQFKDLGDQEGRSIYDSASLTIFINLSHPAVRAAMGDGDTENLQFRRLAYEVAFTEYAIASGNEIIKLDPEIPANDLLYDIRQTLSRVTASAASLYRLQ